MRQFSILVIFVLAFGGAAVLYEKESRKVKGVLTQITELQAQVGDLQAEVKRLNGELEAVKLAERRRPNLRTIANRVRRDRRTDRGDASNGQRRNPGREIMASDVTSSSPAIRSRADEESEAEWNRPTVDAEQYRAEPPGDERDELVVDPYQ
ncbi:hypothetical protein [Microbulbifer halophilus]|uniref:Uncharacterized protein n=1 Tax=Microbulbifer halophilus TaxID=453963 RepID=A0ABW5EER6_9GAMM|nr:hypothetical protein [Microbulbifer halophilus]MCW8127968.1 hypothetical protein [Microbulbifer halophilus]